MAVDTAKTNVISETPANTVSFSDSLSGRNALVNILRSSIRRPIPMEILLSDSDGVELFNRFLVTKYSSGHLLDFWFACKGFHSNVDPTNPEKLFQVAKVIYRTYIKSGAVHSVPLPTLLKQTITDRMSSYHHGYKLSTEPQIKESACTIDRTLFDTAQETIRVLLEETYYPEFLRSFGCLNESCLRTDLTSLDINSEPKKQHPISACCRANQKWRTCSPNQLNQNNDCSSTSNNCQISSQDPFSPQPVCQHCSTEQHSSLSYPALRLTTSWTNSSAHSPLIGLNRMSQAEKYKVCDASIDKPQDLTNSSRNIVYDGKNDCPTSEKPDPKFTSFTAETASAKHPDADLNFLAVCADKSSLSPNVESSLTQQQRQQQQCRPVRDYKSSIKKHSNLAESDPASFVLLLTSRLEKIKESRGKMEKLMSWVNQVDEKQSADTTRPSGQFDPHMMPNLDAMVYKSNQDNSTCHGQLIEEFNSGQTNPYPPCRAMLLQDSSFEGICNISKNTDEDAQGILDEHFSRIWADETSDGFVSRRKRGESAHTVVSQSSVTPYSYGQETLSSSVHAHSHEHDNRRKSGTRRRTAVSAVASLSSAASKTVMSDGYSRKRNGVRSSGKPIRSDARSTASWDSGVVANCMSADIRFRNNGESNHFGEIDTGSLVATASLQALSSSTTELAVVNGELTAKLVEQMIRHFPDQHAPHSYENDPRTGSFAPLYKGYEVCQSHCHSSHLTKLANQSCDMPGNMWNQSACMTDTYHAGLKMHPTSGTSCCPSCRDGATMACNQRHCFHAYSVSHDNPNHNNGAWIQQKPNKSICASSGRSQSFPTASDTSSTFDSGISSTYDQLPLRIRQPNSRENRSQSLHNWQSVSSPSTDSHNRRTPSAPKSNPNQDLDCSTNFPSQTHCCPNAHSNQPDMCDWWNDNHLGLLNQNPHFATCGKCSDCSSNKHIGYQENNSNSNNDPMNLSRPSKSGGGHLLQHWLHLQSEDFPSSHQNSAHLKSIRDTTHNHNRKSHVHHRRSSVQRNNGVIAKPIANNTTLSSDNCKDSDLKSSFEKSELSSTACRTSDSVPGSSSQTTVPGVGLVVGYYLCDDPVPYRTVWTGPLSHCPNTPLAQSGSNESTGELNKDISQNTSTSASSSSAKPTNPSLTLGQFKQLIAKKGVYRYFFKKPSDEFGTGVVHEELTNDDATLPLWDGKVVARIERAD